MNKSNDQKMTVIFSAGNGTTVVGPLENKFADRAISP